ncbi:hypothetical protein BS17DRAFT_791181 [Gyrodon lividus]|nr:hypothetical protein BS17DRAFT_791181 [Gyrodon lividus]
MYKFFVPFSWRRVYTYGINVVAVSLCSLAGLLTSPPPHSFAVAEYQRPSPRHSRTLREAL